MIPYPRAGLSERHNGRLMDMRYKMIMNSRCVNDSKYLVMMNIHSDPTVLTLTMLRDACVSILHRSPSIHDFTLAG